LSRYAFTSAHKDKVAAKFARRVPKLAERLTIAGVENAGRVSDSLYRGAQPCGQGYGELKRLGITIVVDLRNSKPVARETSETREQIKVEATGERYVEIPTSAFLGPTDFQVATFLQLLRAPPNDKIFGHCYFGDDRAGVMIATYRMADEHWTSDQAYDEMRAFHFHKHLLLMGHHVKIFPADYARNPAFSVLRDGSVSGPNSGS
jgi:protein tyrosine/serine phosphatase